MAELDECEVLPVLKKAVVAVPILMASLEYPFLTRIEDTAAYQQFRYGKAQEGAAAGMTMLVIVLVDFLMALLLQIRIEFDHIRHGEGWMVKIGQLLGIRISKLNQPNIDPENAGIENSVYGVYKLYVTRLLVVIGGVLAILLFTSQTLISWRFVVVFLYLSLAVICPLIFIVSNPKLRTIGLKLVKLN